MARELLKDAARLVATSRYAVALTGAGVSTESGIPDFRSKGGLWSRYDPMEYGTIGAFRRDPAKVWRMLEELLGITDARPNPGHFAMARLEQAGHLQGIITQNIDGLHQAAGSRNVVEFHGSLATFSCLSCGAGYSLDEARQIPLPPQCPACREIIKPDVVFFDEQIPPAAISGAEELLAHVDLLLVAGTSCQVAPASWFPQMVAARGGRILEINREPALGGLATLTLAGSFSKMMSGLVEELGIGDFL